MAGMDYFGYSGDLPDRFDIDRRPGNWIVNEQEENLRRYPQGIRSVPRPNNLGAPLRPPTIQEDEEATVQKYVGIGVGVATLLAENLLSHPFVVLRRQCQVNHNARKYHIVPFTLIPVIVHLHQRQGITTLWKGIGSVLVIRGLTLAVEDILSKITPLPKELPENECSFKMMGQHVLLKCITLAIITPFYSASLVETVQSDIASEKPGIFDVFKEGACRLLSWSYPQKGRMLPIWSLVLPTVMYGLLKYVFSTFVRNCLVFTFHQKHKQEREKQGAFPKDWENCEVQEIQASARLLTLVASETLFYPLETILHRLHLQGTRTIIDNLDNGQSVFPILTSYQGTVDCYDTTLTQEGTMGLFKGFGAVVLQFSVHFALVKIVKYVVTQATVLFKNQNPSIEQLEASFPSARTPR